MKYLTITVILGFFLGLGYSCVQKTKEQTIHFSVNMKEEKNVKTLGVRGSIEPFLSWNNSAVMLTDEDKDSIYTGEVVLDIPFDFVELKFIKNEEEMELDGKDNRKIIFDESGKTQLIATFNKIE